MSVENPRSVGTLTVGELSYKDGIFTADFIFSAAGPSIGEDEMKSANIAMTKKLQELLSRNGFWSYSAPIPIPTPLSAREIHFRVMVKTKRSPLRTGPLVLQ
jgi:hypothetical protein